METFGNILKIDPGNVLALNKKGEVLMKLGKYQEAFSEFENASEIDPDNFEILTNKGGAVFAQGKYRQAVRAYNSALEVNSDHIYAILGKAKALVKIELYEESLTYFNDVLEFEAKNINMTEGKWYADSELGNESIKGKTEALTGLGKAFLDEGNWPQAESKFNEVLTLDSEHSEAIIGMEKARQEISRKEMTFWITVLGAVGSSVFVGTFAINKIRNMHLERLRLNKKK